jgi:nitrate reductase gamma subunit
MPEWLTLANGPIFRFTITFLALGLVRLSILTSLDMLRAIRQAGDRRLPYGQILRETSSWLLPIGRLHQTRGVYSFASFVFHLGILAAGLFLGNHISILQANTGLGWGAVAKPLLDWLTLLAIFGGGFLLLHRVYVLSSRKLSGWQDYLLLILLLNIFASGFLAGQPWNPIPYDGLMLFHVINGLIILLTIPFTKISHCVLFPLIRLASEIGWHFPPQAGQQVIQNLHGAEGRKI